MMIGRIAGWTVLVLLAVNDGPGAAAVDVLQFVQMTWSFEVAATTKIDVCADAELLGDDIHLIVLPSNDNPQKDYPGAKSDPVNCAVFNVDGKVPVPTGQTKYELTVSDGTSEQQSGTTSFAFPLGEGVTIDCGGTLFGRFSATNTDVLDAAWICNTNAPVCYVATDATTSTNCVAGLDGDSGLNVCVVYAQPDGSTPGLFGVTSLSYKSDASPTDTVTVSYIPMIGKTMELLSRVQGATGVVSFGECDKKVCSIGDFAPSQSIYELCGVFTDDSGVVTDVGHNTFQDLSLTAEVVTGTTVDFHFYNNFVTTPTYTVKSSTTAAGEWDLPEFTLDCTLITTGFCNGFIDEGSLPLFISVSSAVDDSNQVISPVPPLIREAVLAAQPGRVGDADPLQQTRSAARRHKSAV